MSFEQKIDTLIEKAEQDRYKNRNVGLSVLLPILQTGIGTIAFLGIFGTLYYAGTKQVPMENEQFMFIATVSGMLMFTVFLTFNMFSDEARLFRAMRLSHRLGKTQGRNVDNRAKADKVSKTKAVGRGEEVLEDISKLLQWHYSTSDSFTRDNAMKVLSHRVNARASYDSAMTILKQYGIVVKNGTSNNAALEVVPKTLNDAFNMLNKRISA